MTKYVYVVRSDWYDSYHMYGVYTTLEEARTAVQKYVDEQAELGLTIYKWIDEDTMGEYFEGTVLEGSSVVHKLIQGDEYRIVKIPLNTWLDVLAKK